MPVATRKSLHPTTRVALGILSIVFLFFSFYSNAWNIAEPDWFKNKIRQRESERLVLGKMAKSRQDGIFSGGGLLGLVSPDEKPRRWMDSPFEFGYEAYLDEKSIGAYSPYKSQMGGQGIFFSILDTIVPLNPSIKLTLFYMLTSLFTAVVLILIVQWFYLEFSLMVAVSVLISICFSQWLVLFGRNIFWSLWAFYVPIVMVMYCLRHDRTFTKQNALKFIGLVFIGFLVKVFFTGYEYITTTLIMMLVPMVFYCVLDFTGFKWFFRYTILATFASGLAIFLSMIIICFQVASLGKSWSSGVNHLFFALIRRTSTTTGYFSPAFGADFPNLFQVLWMYLKGSFFEISNHIIQNPLLAKAILKVSYLHLIIFFGVASWTLCLQKSCTDAGADGRRSKALVVSTWFSLLAPLSWFIIFKQHSAVHTQLNFIVWQMPFTIFGFALCGLAARVFLSPFLRQKIHPT